MSWAGRPWSITANLWSLKTQSETEAAVEVVGTQEILLVCRGHCACCTTHM